MMRSEMMADSERLHHAYHLEVALEVGVNCSHLPASVKEIRDRLKTDPHLNNIALSRWDGAVSRLPQGTNRALKHRGDWLSLGTGVCILKAYAKYAAEHEE